ncbi:hypothetical protein [Caenispirillum bisanense]|uniref:hypothetical protein n=1 Tax=Caenispirillum bisanense TaxID=414052 RepID=UPI0031DFCEFC
MEGGDLRQAVQAIEAIRQSVPDLGWHGFGGGVFPRQTRTKDLAEFRSDMTAPGQVEEFRRAVEFLQAVSRTKKPNRRRSSYTWKDIAARWYAQRHPGEDSYISNGMLIAAALALGFQVIPIDGGPNAWINIADSARHV